MTKAHRTQKELGIGIHAPGMAAKAGKKGGAKSAQSDNARWRNQPFTADDLKRAGRTTGRKMKAQRRGLFDPEVIGSGPHTRWHANRGIVKPDCPFCVDAAE
jgi:hypothetical protein